MHRVTWQTWGIPFVSVRTVESLVCRKAPERAARSGVRRMAATWEEDACRPLGKALGSTAFVCIGAKRPLRTADSWTSPCPPPSFRRLVLGMTKVIPKKAYKIDMNWFFRELLMNEKQEGVSYAMKPPFCDAAQDGGFGGFRAGAMPRREPLRPCGSIAAMRHRCPHLRGGSWPSRSRAFLRRPRAYRD